MPDSFPDDLPIHQRLDATRRAPSGIHTSVFNLERAYLYLRFGALCLLLGLTGCGGCLKNKDQLSREELEKQAKEKKDAIEFKDPISLPADTESNLLTVKPGHWHETRQIYKSNRDDLQVVAVESVVRGNEDTKIPGTNFTNEYTRRTSLPKGQSKSIEMQCFVPFAGQSADPLAFGTNNFLRVKSQLLSWPLMTPIMQTPSMKPANELKAHEAQFVVLSPRALSYNFLTVLDAVYWFGDDNVMAGERTRSYQVTLVNPSDNKYAFPHSMLTMTSMAVLLWDDVSPEDLTQSQQQAIVDWLHWGGQIVVSGPSSWGRLQNSFMAPYLPAISADSVVLTDKDFESISNTWVVPDLREGEDETPLQFQGTPMSGLKYELATSAQWLPDSGEMVAEKQVGRGRVVLTTFPMYDPRIYRWKYFSSFVSTGLLRRHSRTIRNVAERGTVQQWDKPFQTAELDPRMHSTIRILTRDLPTSVDARGRFEKQDKDLKLGNAAFAPMDSNFNTPSDNSQATEAMQWGGRAAAWNDYSGISYEALDALKAAAGIELPSRSTILYLLAGYLACLVPLNWLFFRIIGKLEYAWIAAPLMAIIGVVVVTRVARLDIGFARRTTEIAVLELQGSHERAHLTQYLALYTSLSTNYEVEFPENDSVALPLGDVSRRQTRAGSDERKLSTNYGRSDGVQLEPLTVYSNSTEMVHSEQIIPLDGGLRLGARSAESENADVLKNETGLTLEGVLVIRRLAESVEYSWVGDLLDGQTADLQYQDAAQGDVWEKWSENPITRPLESDLAEEAASDTNDMWIGGVLRELVRKTPLMEGQTRMFAYTNDKISQLKMTPKEDQVDGRTLVVAHLTPMKLAGITPDVKIASRSRNLLENERPQEETEDDPQGEISSDAEAAATLN